MSRRNVLIVVVDEMARQALGCAGGWPVLTPRLDRLAAAGTRFSQAYSNSPICVPARAVMQTGLPVHRTRHWDSAEPYDGRIRGWAHRLRDLGHRVVSVGKLHFRSSDDDNGFAPEILPMHVKDGVGWLPALLRREVRDFPAAAELARDVGAGETDYHAYDRRVAAAACRWLSEHAGYGGAPWVLMVSFVSPHYPLRAPEACFRLYDPARLPLPVRSAAQERPQHPAVTALLDFFDYDAGFDEARVRLARAAYFGLVSFVDGLIGEVLAALAASGVGDDTVILFTSDHGEMLGDHGIWTKQVMYEGSVGIPLIVAGGGVPAGRVCATPVSLLDLQATILHAARGEPPAGTAAGEGASLLALAGAAEAPLREILCEYHDGGSITGSFVLRRGRWKLVHHVGYAAQLFDLAADPQERHDIAGRPDSAATLAELDAALRALVDPETASAKAFADQAAAVDRLGGVAAVRARGGLDFGHTPAPAVEA